MNRVWSLDYDGGLFMRVPPEIANDFFSSAFYKLSLKRYVREGFDGFVRFKGALTYLDYKRVIILCEPQATKCGDIFEVSSALADYIEKREIYIQKRAKLGIELKQQDNKHIFRFEDYRSIVDNCMSRELRIKQMWDSFFMCAMQKSGNFSVPGSGKTSSVLGVYAYLKTRGLVKRIVCICPKNAFGTWIDEFELCFQEKEPLHCFNIQSSIYKNANERRRAISYDTGRCNLILFNYESVGTYRAEITSLIDAHTLLVFDEVHKVKRIDGLHAKNALYVARNAIYVVAMTGTPIPNTYLDIYNFLHILFPDEYDEHFGFNTNVLRKPSAGEITFINKKLQPFFCRTTKHQLNVPEANADCILAICAAKTENRLLDILKLKYKKHKLALMIRILQLESNAQLLLHSLDLRDFKYILDDTVSIEDIDYVDYSEEIRRLIESCGASTKFRQCLELVEQLTDSGRPVVIWCIFIDSIKRLSSALEARGIKTRCISGEVELDERREILDDFKNCKFQILLTNPHTLAESVSLHSICHDAIYFEYSYNLVHLLQSKDRIHRLGLKPGQYTQYYFLQNQYVSENGAFSMGEQIYLRLKDKEETMLRAIDNNVLETLPTNEEDLEAIFSKLF